MTTFILPLVYWRPEPERNNISCIQSYQDESIIVTGMENGCLWVFKADVENSFKLSPLAQLIGHKAPVVCLAFCRQDVDVGSAGEEQVLHTVSEDGEILLWNLSDGQCLQSSGKTFNAIPRSLCVSPCGGYIFVGGDCTNLSVLDAQTLDVLGTMSDFQDWIVQILCLCQRENKVYLFVLTLTQAFQVVFDESSRHLAILSSLTFGSFDTGALGATSNTSLVALVTNKDTLILHWDVGSIKKITNIKAPPKESDWASGKFHGNQLYLWTRFSNIYIYTFKEDNQPFLQQSIESKFNSPSQYCILHQYVVSALNQDFEVHSLNPTTKQTHRFKFGDIWLSNTLDSHVTCQALSGHQILRGTKEGLLHLSSFRKLFFGGSDLSVTAHVGPVTCLAVIERNFVSGGHDACLRVWSSLDLSLIHTFRQHASPIEHVFPVPQKPHVLAVAKDHSISLFSMDNLRVLLFLPNFPCPPSKVWWKDHHVMVHYAHGACYAWDTKASQLERTFHGSSVEMLFSHCESHIDIQGHSQRNAVFQNTSLAMLTLNASYVFMVNLKRLLAEDSPIGLHESLLSALLVYNVEPALDEIATLPSLQITLGVRGVNGNLSLMAPRQQVAFVVSPSVTASRLLALFLVARAILLTKGHSETDIQAILTRFLHRLPAVIGPKFCFPSLAFFSKHWLDTLPELQKGSRHLFLWTLQQMPEEKQALIRQYWCQHLPSSVAYGSKTLSKTMCRATVILAIMLCELPSTFSSQWTKEIAQSLVLVMNEEESTKSVYRLSSIELLGRGFATWQLHLNSTQLVRSMVQLSIQQTNTAVTMVATLAKDAVLLIGRAQPSLLVQTMVNDLDHAKTSPEKVLILKCISFLVARDPCMLLPSLPRILESVIRNLDPTLPGTRDLLLQPTTVTLFEILKRFPSVCFHSGHQRLGVGTPEGIIVVWDLKTSTKLHVLEGHTSGVDAVAFSEDAKSLVSYSLKESCIRVWQQSSGLIFFVNQTIKATKSIRHVSKTDNLLSLRLSFQSKSIEIFDDLSRNLYSI